MYKLDLQDFRKSIYPDRPQGIYCGVTYLVKPDIFWKIDIWLFLPKYAQGATKTIRWVKEHISEKRRDIILIIKNQVKEQLPRGKQITGIDVYKAVLENGVTNLEEFKHYLGKSGKNWE